VNITFCTGCALGHGGFAATLAAALTAAGIAHRVVTADCLSGCTRPSAASFRAPGKTAYLFGDLTADDLRHLITFARLYTASPDGNFADARALGPLRHKAIARIPA
jgi:predicted metal-binding protein